MAAEVEQNGFWTGGINSRDDPAYLGQTNYVWGFNNLNRGGIMRTRPGFNEISVPDSNVYSDYHPQGGILFTPSKQATHMVIAFRGVIYVSPSPFTTWRALPGISFVPYRAVSFEIGMKSTITNPDGSLTFVQMPYPVLVMQDGESRAAFWDGATSRHLDPTPINVAYETPIGTAMLWISGRLWVGNGNILRASNLGDPLKFTEQTTTANGGFFTLPGQITALGETPDIKTLLAFTAETTTSFQASNNDRSQWLLTPGFQQLLFRKIGCVSQRAIVNQYGVTWWYSHKGLVALDSALQTYRTSRIHFRDNAMLRSKGNLSSDLSGICLGSFGNFLKVSVPSGDRWNAHTWVMDQTVLDAFEGQEIERPAWASNWTGIRPVQWITGVVDGEERCFAISRDYVPNDKPSRYRLGLWEAFQSQRTDSKLDGTFKRITCGWESKLLAFSAYPKDIQSVELDVSEVAHTVNIRIYFAGRRSQYVLIGQKQVIATMGCLGVGATPLTIPVLIESFRQQERIVRSATVNGQKKGGVQSKNINSRDRGFSIYVEWDGEMSLRAARIYFSKPTPETKMGACEDNETTERYVTTDGDEVLLSTPPKPDMKNTAPAGFIDSYTAKNVEPFYSSR